MCPFSKITKSCERPLTSLGGHLRLRQKSPLISISDYSEGLIIYFKKKELYNGTRRVLYCFFLFPYNYCFLHRYYSR